MKKIALVLLFVSSFQFVKAQDIASFSYWGDPVDGETFIGIGGSSTHLSNPVAPNSSAHRIGGLSFFLDMETPRYGKGEVSMQYTNKLIGDLLVFLDRAIVNPNVIFRSEGSSLSTGILGWVDWNWNLNAPKRLQLAAGFNLQDYFIGATYAHDTISLPGSRASYEPQGYYFSGGPSVLARYAINQSFLVRAKTTYAFGAFRAATVDYLIRDDSYPLPHFFQTQLEIQSRWGFYAALHFQKMINRGNLPNQTKRIDAVLGFRFMI